MQKIVIIGAGAMGCLFAARLSLAGAAVTLVDVDQGRLAVLAGAGVSIHDDRGAQTAPVAAALAAEVTGPADLVMMMTKAQHSAAAIASVAHLAGTGAYALTLQNGLGNAEALAAHFGADRVLMGVTDWPADFTAPNHVDVHGEGHIWLGSMTQAGQDAAQQAVALLNTARMNADFDADVAAAIWEKAAFNGALNALATLLRVPVGDLDRAEGRRLAHAVADETAAIAAAHGVGMNRDRLRHKIDFALTHHKAHLPSMLQDRLAGRTTEIEAINGAIVAAAAAKGLTAPVTQALADLIRMGEPG